MYKNIKELKSEFGFYYKTQFLKKLIKNVKSKHIVYYCDFETILYENKHYIICFAIVNKKTKIVKTINICDVSELEKASTSLMIEFINDCFSIATSKSKFYFHNFSRFDSFFIINIISKLNTDDYIIDLYNPKGVLYKLKLFSKKQSLYLCFYDTFHILPFSLNTISTRFCNIEKGIYNHNLGIDDYIYNKDQFNILKDYCYQDAFLLCESFTNFSNLLYNELKVDIFNSLTISSFSLKLFRLFYYNDVENKIQYLTKPIDNFIRQSYHGGYTDVFKPYCKNGYYYDVNSLYPYVMAENEFPGEIKSIFEITTLNTDIPFDITNFFGFIEVEVFVPNNLNKPFLLYKDKDRGLIAPLGVWNGVYFSEEIKYALTLGYTFKYIKAVEFTKITPFKTFVNDIYQKRCLCKNEDPLKQVYKLILNSLYGKFGMITTNSKSVICTEDTLEYLLNTRNVLNYSALNKLYSVEYKENNVFDLYSNFWLNLQSDFSNIEFSDIFYKFLKKSDDIYPENSGLMSHIASAITSYARIYMHRFINDTKLNIYYTDTDSIVTDVELDPKFVSSTELGKFKLVYHFKEGYFINPKVYSLKISDNNIIYKSKGQAFFDSFEIYEKLYKTPGYYTETFNLFKRDTKNFEIIKKKTSGVFSSEFLKRNKIHINDIWVDTAPLTINNNKQ